MCSHILTKTVWVAPTDAATSHISESDAASSEGVRRAVWGCQDGTEAWVEEGRMFGSIEGQEGEARQDIT